MKAVRIYTGADKKSHFEDLDIPLKPGVYGSADVLQNWLGGLTLKTFRQDRLVHLTQKMLEERVNARWIPRSKCTPRIP